MRKTTKKPNRIDDYLDGYIKAEMLKSFKDYLLGKPKKHNDGNPIQISLNLSKIVKIAMVYSSSLKIKANEIEKILAAHELDTKDRSTKAYYKLVDKKAKTIYAKHRMALLRIEEAFYERGFSEGPCMTMKLLYLSGCLVPDEQKRYMCPNTNKASLELANFLELCNIQGNSEAYTEKAFAYNLKKKKTAKPKIDESILPPD